MRPAKNRSHSSFPLTPSLSRRERESRRSLLAATSLLCAFPLVAQQRAIPFWDDKIPDAIHAEVDGIAALETVRELGRFHRVQGSPGFAASAEHIRKKAVA